MLWTPSRISNFMHFVNEKVKDPDQWAQEGTDWAWTIGKVIGPYVCPELQGQALVPPVVQKVVDAVFAMDYLELEELCMKFEWLVKDTEETRAYCKKFD